jgi:hypothetical protein
MPRIYWDGVVWRFSATGVEAAKKKHSHFGWRHAGKTNFILRYGQSPHINRYIIHPQREIRLIVRFDRGELDCNSQYWITLKFSAKITWITLDFATSLGLCMHVWDLLGGGST